MIKANRLNNKIIFEKNLQITYFFIFFDAKRTKKETPRMDKPRTFESLFSLGNFSHGIFWVEYVLRVFSQIIKDDTN